MFYFAQYLPSFWRKARRCSNDLCTAKWRLPFAPTHDILAADDAKTLKPAVPATRALSQSTLPIPQRPIMLQPIDRQISPLVRVLGSQLFVDVHAVAR